jgi:hypothetical protein
MFRDPTTGEVKNGIIKVSYSHQALIDIIISNPMVTQREMAARFGYTESWISSVIASDSFQEVLNLRREEIIDPVIKASIEERFKALVIESQRILMKKLEVTQDPELALGVLNGASKALGYGVRNPTVQNNNYVVLMPVKAKSSEEWASGRLLEGELDRKTG